MILNEREMQMAKELARELARVEREKHRKFEEAFNNLKNEVMETWEIIKSILENVFKALHDYLDKRKVERSKWHVPIKIEAPPMPDIKIPRLANARSNI